MIERWDLGPPGSKRIRNIAGDYEHIVIPGPILARSTVFLDPNGSEGGINYFLVNHGQPGTLLLQFINTLNIYRIDIATGAMSLLISGSVFPDTLRPGFTDMLELDNPDKGFVYVMIEDRLPLSGTDPFLCLLVDSSRSGVFSGVQIVTFAQYESLGYNKGTPLNSHLVWPHWL